MPAMGSLVLWPKLVRALTGQSARVFGTVMGVLVVDALRLSLRRRVLNLGTYEPVFLKMH